jgi:hypothetical protein
MRQQLEIQKSRIEKMESRIKNLEENTTDEWANPF